MNQSDRLARLFRLMAITPPTPTAQRSRPMNLYNCKNANGGYRITKFNSDYEIETTLGSPASYVVSSEGCDCPQGHKETCRHRKMLPEFLEHNHVDDGWFFIWDTRMWIAPMGEARAAAEEAGAFEISNDEANELQLEANEPQLPVPPIDQPGAPSSASQPAPPASIAPQNAPASAEGAGASRLRRPNL